MPQPKIKTDLAYWLATLRMPSISPTKIRRWLQQFADIRALLSARMPELIAAGLSSKEIASLQNPDWKAVEQDLRWCEKPNCHATPLSDPLYPLLLKELTDAPLVLYIQGTVDLLAKAQIAIVGSRNPTSTGKETAESFAYTLAKTGLVITSGLASGIDGACHRGALAAEAPTIAVTGAGLNHIYPKEHRRLAEEIAANGALISEFPPDTPPIAKNFPQRNRIISGLSLGVVVVEAALRSGSLITARFALEQGREVFAMPGSIHNPLARGCHKLIQQGAKLIETADDILEELGPLWQAMTIPPPEKPPASDEKLTKKQRELLLNIDYAATPLDVIIVRSGLTAGEVSSMLLALELQGWVEIVSGGYARASRDFC
jgi:DNA processing protein